MSHLCGELNPRSWDGRSNAEELTPEWPVSPMCTGPRGRCTSRSRWRRPWRARLRPGRSHRTTGGTGSCGLLLSGSWWRCRTADSTDTPSEQKGKRLSQVSPQQEHLNAAPDRDSEGSLRCQRSLCWESCSWECVKRLPGAPHEENKASALWVSRSSTGAGEDKHNRAANLVSGIPSSFPHHKVMSPRFPMRAECLFQPESSDSAGSWSISVWNPSVSIPSLWAGRMFCLLLTLSKRPTDAIMLQSGDTQQLLIQSLCPDSTWTFFPEMEEAISLFQERLETHGHRNFVEFTQLCAPLWARSQILRVLSRDAEMRVSVPFWGKTRSLTTPSCPRRSNTAWPLVGGGGAPS